MNVRVVYRNYTELNTPYLSFRLSPPAGINFIIPKAKKYLKRFLPLYRKYGNNKFISKIIDLGQKMFFSPKNVEDSDALFYVGMIPEKVAHLPYIVDLEHPIMLLNAVRSGSHKEKKVFKRLIDPQCKGIVPLSHAAARALEGFLGKEKYLEIENKVKVIYPALPEFKDKYDNEADYSVLGKSDTFKILFVGKESYRKGVNEILKATKILIKEYPNIELTVVSDAPDEILSAYENISNIKFLKPEYSLEELIKKFYLVSDVFIMPTHADSFGMVFLEALSSGLPVITTLQYATPEIISDGVNGFLIQTSGLFLDKNVIPTERDGKDYVLDEAEEENIIKQIVTKTKYLIENPDVRRKMSEEAIKDFQPGGKFSIGERNKKLTELFKEIN